MKGKWRLHIHLPKPLHGWREFLGEVGIIVIGVLIALACEQVVESWRWQERVHVVRKSLMSELANDRARWEVDQAHADCMLRSLNNIERWAQSSATTPPPPLDQSLGLFWMHWANWQIANSSQALDHFPIDEQVAIGALYDGIIHRQSQLEAQGPATDRLNILLQVDGATSNRRDIRIAIGELKGILVGVREENDYMVRHFDAVGVKPDRRDFAADINQSCPVA